MTARGVLMTALAIAACTPQRDQPSDHTRVPVVAGPSPTASGPRRTEDLLGAIIDITADSRDLALIFDRDPAALASYARAVDTPGNDLGIGGATE